MVDLRAHRVWVERTEILAKQIQIVPVRFGEYTRLKAESAPGATLVAQMRGRGVRERRWRFGGHACRPGAHCSDGLHSSAIRDGRRQPGFNPGALLWRQFGGGRYKLRGVV